MAYKKISHWEHQTTELPSQIMSSLVFVFPLQSEGITPKSLHTKDKLFILGLHPIVLRSDTWLCAQGSIWNTWNKLGLALCKTSALLPLVPSGTRSSIWRNLFWGHTQQCWACPGRVWALPFELSSPLVECSFSNYKKIKKGSMGHLLLRKSLQETKRKPLSLEVEQKYRSQERLPYMAMALSWGGASFICQ